MLLWSVPILWSGCAEQSELHGNAPSATSTVPAWAEPPLDQAPPPPALGTNVLILLIDDLGNEQLEAYGVHPDQPPTPSISRVADLGMRFDRAYTYPTCSPARAAMLTGRTPRTHGIGRWIEPGDTDFDLPLDEVTIPEMLDHGTTWDYTSALFGKWHVGTWAYADPSFHPLDQGFDWWEGTYENLSGAIVSDGKTKNYDHWEKSTNGQLSYSDTYATTATVDDALARIPKLPEPWFALVAFNAPHAPIHLPPAHLHTQPVTDCEGEENYGPCYRAMVEAMDTEIGRLLLGLGKPMLARTTTIITSDNGAPNYGTAPPFDEQRSKGTLFDGGVRVPMIVAGPYVGTRGSSSQAFVNMIDVLPTVAEIAAVDLTTLSPVPGGTPVDLDGESFLKHVLTPTLPGRSFAYSTSIRPNGPPPYTTEGDMVRTDTHKLIRELGGDAFYRYDAANVDEGPDLLAEGQPPLDPADQVAYTMLQGLLEGLVAAMPYEGP